MVTGKPPAGASAERPGEEQRWLTLQEACALLGVDPTTLRRWSDEGKIPVSRTPGGHRRYDERHVRALLGDDARRGQRKRVSRKQLESRTLSGYEADFIQGARERAWFSAFDADALAALRSIGRELVEVAVRYASLPEGSPERVAAISDGQRIGARYGRTAAGARLSVADTVEAFLYFRFPVVFAVTGIVEQQQMPPKRVARMFADIHQFMDRVLLATVREREAGQDAG